MSGPKVVHVVRTLGRSGGMERNLYRVVAATTQRGLRHEIVLLSDFEDVIDFVINRDLSGQTEGAHHP